MSDTAPTAAARLRPAATSWKLAARACVDQVSASLGLLAWRQQRMRRGLTVLMYHRVLPMNRCIGYPLDALVIPEEVFAEQVRWLAAHCRVLPLAEAAASLQQGELGRKPLVSITFDDGYGDNSQIAAPILEASGLRATFFISTDFVSQAKPLWHDRAADAWCRLSASSRAKLLEQAADQPAHRPDNGARNGTAERNAAGSIRTWMQMLKDAPLPRRLELVDHAESLAGGTYDETLYQPMTVTQLGQLSSTGHEIGGHTVTHPILPQLDDQRLRQELTDSADWLQETLGTRPVSFCYPNGDYDDRVLQAVRAAGYRFACTTQPGLNEPNTDPLRLSRLPITMHRTMSRSGEHDERGFRAELSGLRDLWRETRGR